MAGQDSELRAALIALEIFRMEIHALWLVQHLLFALWVNGLLTIGLAGAQQGVICNESLMLQNLPLCGKSFQEMMRKVDSSKWCNLTEFIL
ncbi:receptor activity-modifying protein 3 isoform X2 [Podarcis muralis]